MVVIFILLLFFHPGTSIQPQFKNAKPYTPIDSSRLENLPKQLNATNPGPYGFSSATILYHGNIDVNDNKANPVIEIKSGLSGSQIQIRVETKVNGASICVMDNIPQDGSESCGKGQIDTCYTPASDGMKLEFYCTESCDSDNVDFFYRIVKSPNGADDLWCSNLPTNDWPSNLLPIPRTYSPHPTTPSNVDKVSHGNNIGANAVVIFGLVLTARLIFS